MFLPIGPISRNEYPWLLIGHNYLVLEVNGRTNLFFDRTKQGSEPISNNRVGIVPGIGQECIKKFRALTGPEQTVFLKNVQPSTFTGELVQVHS